MTVAFFVTSDLDLALTKVAEGRPVLYCGPHQGVFSFESVKAVALRRFRSSPRPACVLGLPEGEESALRQFLVGVRGSPPHQRNSKTGRKPREKFKQPAAPKLLRNDHFGERVDRVT